MKREDSDGNSNGQTNGFSSSVDFISKDLETDITGSMEDMKLTSPDMNAVKRQREERTRAAMEAFNPALAHKLLPKALSPTEKAAIDIQRVFRGYLGRKKYFDKLYEKYEKLSLWDALAVTLVLEEAEMDARRKQQVYEGEILIDNYHLEQGLEDKEILRRNRTRSADSHATTIQRAWKAFQRHRSGVEIPHDPVYVGRAEDGYNIEEFPTSTTSVYHDNTRYYGYDFDDYRDHMHEHDHAKSQAVDINDIFNDSLENRDDDDDDYDGIGVDSGRSESPELARSFPGDYLVDDEFSGTFESMDLNFSRFKIAQDLENIRQRDFVSSAATLPEPTTDWDTIESVLTNESGVNSPENEDDLNPSGEKGDEEVTEDLSSRYSSGPNLQLCFVDDAEEESDVESDPEVRVYIVDDDNKNSMKYLDNKSTVTNRIESSLFDERELDSRDSGCVPGDIADVNIDYVTDYTPNRLESEPVPAEESKRVLFSLQLHEQHDMQQKEHEEEKKRESVAPNSITLKPAQELRLLKQELEDKIQVVSNELVECLMERDGLHAEQESLLMEVEDLSKLAQGRQRLEQSKNSSKVKVTQ
eukprot:gene10880-12036_t